MRPMRSPSSENRRNFRYRSRLASIYFGHRETQTLLTQQNHNECHTKQNPFSLVLFDEIEKASDSLWQSLSGVLDKAMLTLGDNRRVDFELSMIFMTSNLGARELSQLIKGVIGFARKGKTGCYVRSSTRRFIDRRFWDIIHSANYLLVRKRSQSQGNLLAALREKFASLKASAE